MMINAPGRHNEEIQMHDVVFEEDLMKMISLTCSKESRWLV